MSTLPSSTALHMRVQALQRENPERSIQMSYAIVKACLSEQNTHARTQALELISSRPDEAIEIFRAASSELAFQIRLIDRCLTSQAFGFRVSRKVQGGNWAAGT